jgi:hypothetical protein
MNGESSAESLRTRYYDWCSAKIAEQFLKLSSEEVWRRADRLRGVSSGGGDVEGSEPMVPAENFEVVRVLAQQLASELGLPAFDEWVEQYRADPRRFEREILTHGVPGPTPESTPPPTAR